MYRMQARAGFRLLAIVAVLLLALPGAAAAQGPVFPGLIPLPIGFGPEGIATGRGTSVYSGSLSGGQGIYRGDLRTGMGAQLVNAPNRSFAGMKVDQRSNYLFVAGAASGQAYIYNAGTGAEIGTALQLAPAGTSFINDVAITGDAAYFTDSFAPVLYRVPLGPAGQVARPVAVQTIPLGGEWQQVATPGAFNANGIAATPDGRYLIIVNTTVGKLFRVDPASGDALAIDLHGASVGFGDGILLAGHTLYVVRNFLNEVAVVALAPDFASGVVEATVTNGDFNVPTGIAAFGDALYVVNAKFGTPPTGTPYELVKLPAMPGK